jgi:hypothetical protein
MRLTVPKTEYHVSPGVNDSNDVSDDRLSPKSAKRFRESAGPVGIAAQRAFGTIFIRVAE